MLKKTFKYCATHKEDEAYMQKMCSQGWAAIRLVEGFWTFEKCAPNQYCYRICYLRGKKNGEAEEIKREYAAMGIEFVSRYSFWAIFRSRREFRLYTEEEDAKICKKIYAPMPIGAILSWLLFGLGIFLAGRVSGYFWIFNVLIAIYGSVCTRLAFAYRKLLKAQS